MMHVSPWRAAAAFCAFLIAAIPAQHDLAGTSPSDLKARLPAATTLVERGDELRWEIAGGPSFRALEAADGLAVLDIGGRRLSVAGSVLRAALCW